MKDAVVVVVVVVVVVAVVVVLDAAVDVDDAAVDRRIIAKQIYILGLWLGLWSVIRLLLLQLLMWWWLVGNALPLPHIPFAEGTEGGPGRRSQVQP